MDSQPTSFKGHNGTLMVGPEGVQIKRSFSQALASGHLLHRQVDLPYSSLQKVHHQSAGTHQGFLQFVAKTGAPGISQLNRRHKIHFTQMHDHVFRQAKKLIDQHLQQLAQNQIIVQPPSTEPSGRQIGRPLN